MYLLIGIAAISTPSKFVRLKMDDGKIYALGFPGGRFHNAVGAPLSVNDKSDLKCG
jgi:hypothetical protein